MAPLATEQDRGRTTRFTHIVFSAVIAAALMGFLIGIDDGVPRPDPDTRPPAPPAAAPHVLPALSYAQMRERDTGPNREWRSDLARLSRPDADITAVPSPTPAQKLTSLAARADRRAYDGAPPVIPHSVDQLSSAACLACHQDSVRVGTKESAILPHPYLSACQQCHVQDSSRRFEPFVLASNGFDGLPAALEGDRAWTGAPPVVPHSTFMRQNCSACHGPTGAPGLESTHPWRQNCLQCHAPSAVLDQGISSRSAPFLPPPPVDEP